MSPTAPSSVRFEPRGAALELFLDRTSAEIVLAGSAGTGKSVACLFRLHLACLKHPGIRCLIVRKTAISLGSTTLVSFDEKVAAEAQRQGVLKWYGGSTREAASYKYSNGSRIVVGGLDKPEKVMSSEYDLVFADEATELTITDWEALGTRLRNGKLGWQQQIAACNPSHPKHWIKQRADTGVLRLLPSRHRDNPAYTHADGTPTQAGREYLGRLDNLTGVRRLRLRDGIWAAAEGLVYEGWDDAVHLVDRFDIPEDWPRLWSVDFGYTNPFVLQCWAEDPDGRLYLYREIYRTKRLVEDHAKDILKIVAPDGQWVEPQPQAIVCDHDAEDRATLYRHLGLSTTPAKKSVSDGLQAVQTRLRPAGDGRPRLFVLRDSLVFPDPELRAAGKPLSTLDEFPAYVWAVKPGGEAKEEPLKENDHGMDATRYAVAHKDLRARANVRWI